MYQLSLTMSHYKDPKKIIDVRWDIHNTPVGLLWLKTFKGSLDGVGDPFPRFTGFLYGPKTMESLSETLNRCIETINKDGRYHIKERADGTWNQDFSNAIHHHFEVLVGTVENPTEFFKKSERKVYDAALGLNHLAHDMECLQRAQERVEKYPDTYFSGLIMEMIDAKRFSFPDFVYDAFTLDTAFGDLFLHYSQIGKTWWEVFLDEDEHIFPEAIDPHFALSGGFDVFFGSYTLDKEMKERFESFLIEHGQDPKNKRLCLGSCPVGSLVGVEDKTPEEWRKLIGEHCNIQDIRLLKNDQVIASKKYIERNTYSYFWEGDVDWDNI